LHCDDDDNDEILSVLRLHRFDDMMIECGAVDGMRIGRASD
jgi:hypothetical protein